uniref:C-type lectin domain-containing protein n=1 Tax=Acrobeloides nanus TaxID=290746 RepID=A0A914CW08_9BILA
MWLITCLFISIFLIKNSESESQCSSPYPCNYSYTYNAELDQCYKLYAGGVMDFNGAEDKCVQDGAHLASIHSEKENEFVTELAFTDGGTTSFCKWINAWIGLNFTNGNWSWTDGTPLDYTKWGCNLPQDGYETCAFTNTAHSSDKCGDWYGLWDNAHE